MAFLWHRLAVGTRPCLGHWKPLFYGPSDLGSRTHLPTLSLIGKHTDVREIKGAMTLAGQGVLQTDCESSAKEINC